MATVKRRADLILPGDVILACPPTGDRQVTVTAVEPMPPPYVRLYWDAVDGDLRWYTAEVTEGLPVYVQEERQAAPESTPETASVPARDLRAGDVLASGGATDGRTVVAVEPFWAGDLSRARVAVLLSGHAPQVVDADFPVTIRPRDPREADPLTVCGAIREGWDDASCTRDPGHGGDHDPPHAHHVDVYPWFQGDWLKAWGWRCLTDGCTANGTRTARVDAEVEADAHRWHRDAALNAGDGYQAILLPLSGHTVDLWSYRGPATSWGWTCRDCPSTGTGFTDQGTAAHAAARAHAVTPTPPHTANTQGKEDEEEERDADTQQADTASRELVFFDGRWRERVLADAGPTQQADTASRASCAACGAPNPDGPVSGDGEPWCSDCYAETDSSSRIVLTDDECGAILSTVEAAARDAGSVITIRGAMWSPIFRAVENVIAERMAQQHTNTEGGTTS